MSLVIIIKLGKLRLGNLVERPDRCKLSDPTGNVRWELSGTIHPKRWRTSCVSCYMLLSNVPIQQPVPRILFISRGYRGCVVKGTSLWDGGLQCTDRRNALHTTAPHQHWSRSFHFRPGAERVPQWGLDGPKQSNPVPYESLAGRRGVALQVTLKTTSLCRVALARTPSLSPQIGGQIWIYPGDYVQNSIFPASSEYGNINILQYL